MIDLHALTNNFEHSVSSIEPTAVHRCVGKIIEFDIHALLLINNFERRVLRVERTIAVHSR